MGYFDTFEAPVVIKIDGRDIALSPLTQRDYLPWLSELTESARKRDTELVPAMMKGEERFKLLRGIARQEMIPQDLEPLTFTAKGTIRIIEMAMLKAGVSATDAARFIDSRSAKDNEELAVRVSGLFTNARIAEMYPPPNSIVYGAIIQLLISKGIFTDAELKSALTPEVNDPNRPAPESPAGA